MDMTSEVESEYAQILPEMVLLNTCAGIKNFGIQC